jgi:hypothetical protein
MWRLCMKKPKKVVRVLSKAIASDDRVTAEVVLFQPFEKFIGCCTPVRWTNVGIFYCPFTWA